MWAAATARVQWVPRWAAITCGASLQTLWLMSAQPTFGRLSQVAFRPDRAWAPRTDTALRPRLLPFIPRGHIHSGEDIHSGEGW